MATVMTETTTAKVREEQVTGLTAENALDYKLQAILETLGVCGILHTEKHTEPFYKYINLAVAPRSSHNSDWQYPVDFWKGKNGIDWIAFHHWFGEYEEIKNEIVLITRKEND